MDNNYPVIETMQQFYNILKNNQSIVVFKFSADWCGPCKKIESTVNDWFQKLTNDTDIQTMYVNVDDSFELYAFLKTKKMIQGIPAILAYYKNNTTHIFDDSVVGGDIHGINLFFQRCLDKYERDYV
jgi:thiol-disulfide isomerase/thioredoxin